MAELVQFQAVAAAGAGVLPEQDPRPVIAQPGTAGVGADITGRGAARGHGPAGGEEQRPTGASGSVGQAQQPGQEVRGPGVPVDELGVAALGPDGRAP